MEREAFENPSTFNAGDEFVGNPTEKEQSRNSLSHEQVEQELNDLIDSYRKSLERVSHPDHESFLRDDSTTFLPNPDVPQLTSGSVIPVSSTPYFPDFTSFQEKTSNFLTETDVPSAVLTDLKIHEPLLLNDHLTYGNNFFILPSEEPINFQFDETVTYKKMFNTGISSQLSKQISFLLYELNRLKQENEKKKNELMSCQMELNSAKNQLILAQNKGKVQSEKDLSGVIQEIFVAQKIRDAAMAERLKEANFMKNAAMAIASHKVSSNENDTVTSLVRSQSLDDLKESTSKFLQAIANEKEKRRIANEQEIEAILFERDIIHRQKKGLEQEMKLLSEKLKCETDLKNGFQKEMFELEKQRNQLLNDVDHLQNEMKNHKICESLYKSLSREEELHQQFSHKLSQLTNELVIKNKQMKTMKLDLEKLQSHSEEFNKDNKFLISKCSLLEDQLRKERKQVERLNRLVEVLRRKLKEGSVNIQF